ncbi:MAG: carboxypeptidase-like regulatory domain-containing protein, partial [Pyrinomonadaceae bacterium]
MKIKSLLSTALLLILSISTQSQTSRGTVSGTVLDVNGAVIPGANVVLTNQETGIERTTISNGDGFYRFDAVDPGTYTVKIGAPGFGDSTKTGIVVSANQIADI